MDDGLRLRTTRDAESAGAAFFGYFLCPHKESNTRKFSVDALKLACYNTRATEFNDNAEGGILNGQ